MKKILLSFIVMVNILICTNSVYAEQIFKDVSEDFWAYDEINYVVKQNMMSGYPDLSFKPNNPISKAEAATVLVKYLGIEVNPVDTTSFSDVYASDWYAPYVEAGKGLFPLRVAFNGDHPFLPNHPACREDIAYAIVVALGYSDDLEVVDESILNMFSDQESLSSDTRAAVAFGLKEKLVSGYPDGRFGGQDPLTRAEFAAMMYKAAIHGRNTQADPRKLEVYVAGQILPIYNTQVGVTRFAGSGERDTVDNNDLLQASFTAPASITCGSDGVIYNVDSGKLRTMDNGQIGTIEFTPAYIAPNLIEEYNGSLYFVSDPYEYEDGTKEYAIVRKSGNSVELLYTTDAVYSRIYDISIYDGKMYFMQYNAGYDINYLCEFDLGYGEYKVLKELDGGYKGIDVYEGVIYLANTEKAYVSRLPLDKINEKPEIYCGTENDYRIVDGSDNRLFDPRKIECKDGYIYILDYNMIRRAPIMASNWNVKTETLAGRFTADVNPDVPREYFLEGWHRANGMTFAPSSEMDFCFDKNGDILVTDPKKSVIWKLNLHAM